MTIQEIQTKLYEKLKPSGWAYKLKSFILSEDFTTILTVLYESSQNKKHFTPILKDLFRAFEECPYNELKVVIIEQEPYTQAGIADGIAFSCSKGQPIRTSLEYIFDDIERNQMSKIDRNPDLKRWSNQGVLLLNASLTCEIDNRASHAMLWEPFIHFLFDMLSAYNTGIVYVYMGSQARKWSNSIPSKQNYKFFPSHPISTLYSKSEYWSSGDLFNKINAVLQRNNGTEILW